MKEQRLESLISCEELAERLRMSPKSIQRLGERYGWLRLPTVNHKGRPTGLYRLDEVAKVFPELLLWPQGEESETLPEEPDPSLTDEERRLAFQVEEIVEEERRRRRHRRFFSSSWFFGGIVLLGGLLLASMLWMFSRWEAVQGERLRAWERMEERRLAAIERHTHALLQWAVGEKDEKGNFRCSVATSTDAGANDPKRGTESTRLQASSPKERLQGEDSEQIPSSPERTMRRDRLPLLLAPGFVDPSYATLQGDGERNEIQGWDQQPWWPGERKEGGGE